MSNPKHFKLVTIQDNKLCVGTKILFNLAHTHTQKKNKKTQEVNAKSMWTINMKFQQLDQNKTQLSFKQQLTKLSNPNKPWSFTALF